MPKARCPTCATVVAHAAGSDPICPTCGFSTSPSEAARPSRNGLAVTALACGIASVLVLLSSIGAFVPASLVVFLTAPAAVVLGFVALDGHGPTSARSMAIIAIALGALGLLRLAFGVLG